MLTVFIISRHLLSLSLNRMSAFRPKKAQASCQRILEVSSFQYSLFGESLKAAEELAVSVFGMDVSNFFPSLFFPGAEIKLLASPFLVGILILLLHYFAAMLLTEMADWDDGNALRQLNILISFLPFSSSRIVRLRLNFKLDALARATTLLKELLISLDGRGQYYVYIAGA